MRKSLVLHYTQIAPIRRLNFEQKGMLFDAIISYQFEQTEPELPEVLQMAFSYIKNQLDIDNQKYLAICERNRKNGLKGGRPAKDEKPSGFSGNPKKPKKAENENENENDILFADFWNLYDKKVGAKNKCEKKWSKLKPETKKKIIEILPRWKNQFSDKQFQPYPETFLNQERWNDEIIPPTNGTGPKNITQKILQDAIKPGY